MQANLLFYRKLRKELEGYGLIANPYDPSNMMTKGGKQLTVAWHVDDLKSSHVDPKVNDEFQKWLQAEYGQVKAVTVTRGKRHVYLGIVSVHIALGCRGCGKLTK